MHKVQKTATAPATSKAAVARNAVKVGVMLPLHNVDGDGKRMVVSRDYTLTSFDEKVYAIPALNVKVNGKNFHGNQLALKVSVLVKVLISQNG